MSFHVGQLVVCVDDKPRSVPDAELDGLRRGTVYTIREVGTDLFGDIVRLVEIMRPPDMGDVFEPPYWADRFRPVDDSKLEVFRKIAASPRKRIEVGA